jgi:predicted nuclease of predicted toxin-antitoxin system
MRFLLDQGLPRSAAALLRNRGIDAVHVGEIGLVVASDPEILLRGRR